MKINQSLISIFAPITPYELRFKMAADGEVEQDETVVDFVANILINFPRIPALQSLKVFRPKLNKEILFFFSPRIVKVGTHEGTSPCD